MGALAVIAALVFLVGGVVDITKLENLHAFLDPVAIEVAIGVQKTAFDTTSTNESDFCNSKVFQRSGSPFTATCRVVSHLADLDLREGEDGYVLVFLEVLKGKKLLERYRFALSKGGQVTDIEHIVPAS
ncbi:MAG TPA: hypothetical protein VMC43_02565 [Candidatus Paceibacterota bacterium]|nr:hypothetical protein [Candidatus Paceibacterota bacterium]